MNSSATYWIDNEIPIEITLPDNKRPKAILIALHGLLGYRNSDKFVQIAETGKAKGYVVIRFDQAGSGENKRKTGDSLISARMNDIERVVEFSRLWLKNCGFFAKLPICLFGSSFGGYLAYIFATKHKRVKSIVTWSTPYNVEKIKGFLLQKKPFNFLANAEDPLGTPDSLEPVLRNHEIKNALVIHGTKDEIVPWSEGQKIYDLLALPKRFVLIDNADHRFMDNSIRAEAVNLTFRWFDRWTLSQINGS